MELKTLKIKDIHPYERNARKNDQAVDAVAKSIEQCSYVAPIVVDENHVILAGHTRWKALKKMGRSECECIVKDGLTEEQKKKYRLLDNKTNELADWDFDLLADELDGLDFGDLELDWGLDCKDTQKILKDYVSLEEKFIAPPFSVLDSKAGYWQERKRLWKLLGIKSEIGREENLLKAGETDKKFKQSKNLKYMAPSTSIFDPVLCEVSYSWFCVEKGSILDPFAGGSVRGIVASVCGYDYHGNDLRKEQIEANIKNANEIGIGKVPNWTCGDSINIDQLQPGQYDMIFSCPPYADLEVYSDDPRDLSNMEYNNFIDQYSKIIKKSCDMLKDNRFAVFVVGEVRDKKGFYRNFVADTKNAFIKAGLKLYNDIVFLEPIGTACLRADRTFGSFRKTVKTHQNVLVFYKGDPQKIKENFQPIITADIKKYITDEV